MRLELLDVETRINNFEFVEVSVDRHELRRMRNRCCCDPNVILGDLQDCGGIAVAPELGGDVSITGVLILSQKRSARRVRSATA